MREDEKQALIERAEQLIKHAEEARDEIPFGLGDDVEGELALVKIAMASLTSEPVYQERRYQFIGKRQLEYWADINKSTYGYLPESERRLIYTTPPAPSVPNEPVSRGYTLPDGWTLVPIEPSLAMLTMLGLTGSFESMIQKYHAMLEAAPEPEVPC